ncbi:hypothetical protein D3C81_827320 [compost metagenome]
MQIQQGVAALLDIVAGGVGGGTALGVDIATHIPLVQHARQTVVSRDFQQTAGDLAVIVATLAAASHILRVAVGVAGTDVPTLYGFTRDLQFETAVANLGAGFVALAGTGHATSRRNRQCLRHVLQVGLEDREGGIEGTIEILALDTGLVVLAFDRIQQRVPRTIVALSLVDLGVAGIPGVVLVEVIHQAGIGHHTTVFFVLVVGIRAADLIVRPTETGTQNQAQIVRNAEARG